MIKVERIKEYNIANRDYNITGIKKISKDNLNYQKVHFAKSLDELYNSYSDLKDISYKKILQTYEPLQIIGLQGSSVSYSVTLQAKNGDYLWITRDNNYLLEVTDD